MIDWPMVYLVIVLLAGILISLATILTPVKRSAKMSPYEGDKYPTVCLL